MVGQFGYGLSAVSYFFCVFFLGKRNNVGLSLIKETQFICLLPISRRFPPLPILVTQPRCAGFQHVDAFAQLRHLVSQDGILLSELFQFFVFAHASTLLACSLLCKPLVLRVSYTYSFSSNSPFCRQKPTQEPANGIPKAR